MALRQSKIDEDLFNEKVNFFTKIFIYNNIVSKEPLRLLLKNLDKSVIAYKYGRNQNTVRNVATDYYHFVTGCELQTNKNYFDYIVNGKTKFIILFSNSSDNVCMNLLKIAEKYQLAIITYSEFDNKYHLGKDSFNSCFEIINKMKEINDLITFTKYIELFPELDLIPDDLPDYGLLNKCLSKSKIF
uniref:Uncharacterized protein n=1 Tax=viral metagenome TaxID=1070528 RepID=A0A6C0I7R9_9ZZZZ